MQRRAFLKSIGLAAASVASGAGIVIESDFFTGWMFKAEYWELLGTDD